MPFLPEDRFLVASALIVLGLVFDAMDGIVARRFGSSRLGADLDTLSDSLTFVVAPSLMVLKYYSTPAYVSDPEPYAAALASALVLFMGMLRLARFNSNPSEGEEKTFQGLPTPWCAIAIVLTVLVGVPTRLALPLFALLAFLMMSSVAYPKSKGRVKPLAYAMMASALLLVVILFFFPRASAPFVRVAFVVAALAIALTPFAIRVRRRGETAP